MVTETSIIRYECEHCGTLHGTKERAEKCSEKYLLLKEFEQAQP